MRPKSIIWFERLFMGAIVVGIVNSVLAYQTLIDVPEAQPLGPGFLIGSLVVGVAINFLLWYLVARRGSNIARWVLVVLFGLGAVSLLFSLMAGTYPEGAAGVLGALGWVLQAGAVVFLFQRDANIWLTGDPGDHDLDETFQ